MKERYEIFTRLISKINRNIRRIKTEEMAEFELKSPHVSCLYYLYKEKKLCASELSDRCDEDKAAISRSIDYLEDAGYIKCDVSGTKRYKADLSLTDKGLAVAEKIAAKIDRVLMLVGEGLTEQERRALYEGLETVSANLEGMVDTYKK